MQLLFPFDQFKSFVNLVNPSSTSQNLKSIGPSEFNLIIYCDFCRSDVSAEHEVSVNETVEIVEKLEVSDGSGNELESMETNVLST